MTNAGSIHDWQLLAEARTQSVRAIAGVPTSSRSQPERRQPAPQTRPRGLTDVTRPQPATQAVELVRSRANPLFVAQWLAQTTDRADAPRIPHRHGVAAYPSMEPHAQVLPPENAPLFGDQPASRCSLRKLVRRSASSSPECNADNTAHPGSCEWEQSPNRHA